MRASVVVVGAGEGERLGGNVRKAWVEIAGRPLWWHSCRAFRDRERIREVILVVHPQDLPRFEEAPIARLAAEAGIGRMVAGGASRLDSVLAGVRATDPESRDVLVHDAARPFVARDRIAALLAALDSHPAAILATRVSSTVKRAGPDGTVAGTLDRESLRLATTPQGARRELLLRLLQDAAASRSAFTDESSLLESRGEPVTIVEDEGSNMKITTPDDLALARARLEGGPPRVGYGYDIHRLVPGRPLKLGGVAVPSELGLEGHSDADCLLHAVIDALLGASGLPDIGEHFPDTDPRWKGADSSRLLESVLALLRERDLRPLQVDCTLVAERPRLGPWKAVIKERLMELLSLPADRVAVKARTAEGLDAIGRGDALAAYCTAVVSSQGRS